MTAKAETMKSYLRFCLLSFVSVLILAAVGYWPTRNLGGSKAVSAMLGGCAVCLVSSWCGGLPIVLARSLKNAAMVNAALGSMLARLMAVMMFGAMTVFSGWFERSPLLIWIGIGYVVMLVPDTLFALQATKSLSKQPPAEVV